MTIRRPAVGVGAVIFKGDHVLMVKRGKEPRKGQWSIPGGHQEWGETTAEGASREVMEETGIACEIKDLLDVIDGVGPEGENGPDYHFTLVDYWGEWVSGQPEADDDADDARWMTEAEVDQLETWSETKKLIAKARALRKSGP